MRKALFRDWPYDRIMDRVTKRRSAAAICLGCRQKAHILCVRLMCRGCCEAQQAKVLSPDCECHTVMASKKSAAKKEKIKAKQEEKKQAAKVPATNV